MHKALWTIFLVVALQGMSVHSTALASPIAEKAAVAETLSAPENRTARLEARAVTATPSLRVASERRPAQDRPEILSKNFASPKPVQIYWFFGAR